MIFQRWNSLVNAWQLTDKPQAGDGDEPVRDGLLIYIATFLLQSIYDDVRYYTVGDSYQAIGAFVSDKIVVQIDITRV